MLINGVKLYEMVPPVLGRCSSITGSDVLYMSYLKLNSVMRFFYVPVPTVIVKDQRSDLTTCDGKISSHDSHGTPVNCDMNPEYLYWTVSQDG